MGPARWPLLLGEAVAHGGALTGPDEHLNTTSKSGNQRMGLCTMPWRAGPWCAPSVCEALRTLWLMALRRSCSGAHAEMGKK